MLGGARRGHKRRVNGPRNIPRGGRGQGNRRRQWCGTDGLREVTEGAALMGLTMRAGRRLMLAGRAAGHHRTVWHPTGNIGAHAEAASARCENLHQESQQENWQHQFTPLPQNSLHR